MMPRQVARVRGEFGTACAEKRSACCRDLVRETESSIDDIDDFCGHGSTRTPREMLKL